MSYKIDRCWVRLEPSSLWQVKRSKFLDTKEDHYLSNQTLVADSIKCCRRIPLVKSIASPRLSACKILGSCRWSYLSALGLYPRLYETVLFGVRLPIFSVSSYNGFPLPSRGIFHTFAPYSVEVTFRALFISSIQNDPSRQLTSLRLMAACLYFVHH